MSSLEYHNIDVNKLLEKATIAFSVVFWLYILYAAFSGASREILTIVFLGGCMSIYVLNELADPLDKEGYLNQMVLIFILLISIASTIYMYINFSDLNSTRIGYAYTHEYMMALLFVTSIVYVTWREFGSVFLFLILFSIIFGYFGQYMPGVFSHGGLSTTRILNISMLDISGIYGSISMIIAAWVALFLLYAGLLKGYGAFEIITIMALRSGKYVKTGVFQTAVIASAIIGSINGSRTANAAMTGSITIPIMVDSGLKPKSAAAIEADASTLGQILPPVMGAGGFLMASFLGISYADVMIVAALPAIIVIVCLFVGVHLTATSEVDTAKIDINQKISGIMDENDVVTNNWINALVFLPPFILLIYLLGVLRYTIPTSGLATVLLMMLTGSIYTIHRDYNMDSSIGDLVISAIKDTVDGFYQGAVILAPIALIVATINIAVDIFLATGVPNAITLAMMDMTDGIMLFTVLLALAVCIILGLGMPTVAAYTIVAILIAPTLINQFGVEPLAAHFFVFYGACLSGITPPIAPTCAVTSGIAKSKFLETASKSVKLFAPMFILPISFIYREELIVGDPSLWTVAIFISTIVGSIMLIYSLNSSIEAKKTNKLFISVVLFLSGIIMMTHPNITFSYIIGAASILIAMLTLKIDSSKAKQDTASVQ